MSLKISRLFSKCFISRAIHFGLFKVVRLDERILVLIDYNALEFNIFRFWI
jgi:hypothetical protein